MKEIKLSCPFTGVEFTALEYADGRIVVKHPLTDELLTVNWNCSIKRYNMPKEFFEHIPTVTPKEASEILDVSKARISQIIETQTIPTHEICGKTVFILSDVLEYKKNRKVGAPKKVKTWNK